MFCILTAGLAYPEVTIALAALHFVGRILYTIGYRISPRARMIGAPFMMLSTMALMITALVATWNMGMAVCESESLWSVDL